MVQVPAWWGGCFGQEGPWASGEGSLSGQKLDGWWPSEQRAAEECCFSLRGTPSVIAVSSFGSDAKPTKYNWELGCRIPMGPHGYSSVRLWV